MNILKLTNVHWDKPGLPANFIVREPYYTRRTEQEVRFVLCSLQVEYASLVKHCEISESDGTVSDGFVEINL